MNAAGTLGKLQVHKAEQWYYFIYWQNDRLKSIWKTKFTKLVLIVYEVHQFSVHSLSTKKFETINFKWLNK